ncbi:Vacuole effluxer Atg22 like [Sphingobacterium mizutaii]|uniref:Vacuole effluxer Atg22 like n=2 Tax=Sphingobacterium mizutaii TaxID=1010 RepID=A0AAJ4XBV8_9SPHI|nr:MFS transporter [Sphingobacterium mizutaii]SDL06230.1 MFS transporter, UMF1 family [Sphingobacterium mizutaii]SNV50907.1 Vacuole effluxer Atg22 like [Sphingobacterium mizutaii]
MKIFKKNDKRLIRSWSMYDWANSAYNLVINSTIFPVYYTTITKNPETNDTVSFFGFEIINTALSNFALSIAYLLMALGLPFISAYSDAAGKRKFFMKLFTYIGAIACMGLFFFKINTLEWGIFCYAIAAMGYIGGVAFNNSYLPIIASPDQQDRVSAQGFAYGYVGCVTLQIICFVFIFKPEWFGITDASFPARFSFLLVGLWWLLFAQIPFRFLPRNRPTVGSERLPFFTKVKKEFTSVLGQIKQIEAIKTFLPAYFFYSMGIQTLLIVAAAFGEKVLNLGASKLIASILLIQIVAIGGAYIMSVAAKRFGNIKVLLVVVFFWILICCASFYMTTEYQFYGMAFTVGLLMGGIQSLSRSTYSKLIPEHIEDTTSFFSFYDVSEKVAIVIGLFSFGIIEQITQNIRYSALFLSVYFIIGFLLLFRVLKFNKLQIIESD